MINLLKYHADALPGYQIYNVFSNNCSCQRVFVGGADLYYHVSKKACGQRTWPFTCFTSVSISGDVLSYSLTSQCNMAKKQTASCNSPEQLIIPECDMHLKS